MITGRPVTEDDLHAYIDNALDPGRRADIDAYLLDNPDAARRLEGFVQQRAFLRATLDPIVAEEIPPNLALGNLIGTQRMPSHYAWRSAAAAVLLLLAGGSAGWFGRGLAVAPSAGIAAVAQEALTSFDVYGSDPMRPVEIKAADRSDLLKWLSKRLGRPIAAPDLTASGYDFLGGRLVATPHGPAGLFMYDNGAGARLVMLVRQMANEKDAPMSEHGEGPVAGFAWAQNGLGYSLVGAASPGVLHPLADEVRRHVGAPT